MQKIYLTAMTILAAAFCFNTASAQDDLMQGAKGEAKVEKEKKGFFIQPTSVGLSVGTSGVGLEFCGNLNKRFNLRAGFGYIPKFNYSKTDEIGQYTVKTDYKTQAFQLHFFGDWFVFGPNFHLTAGVAGYMGGKSTARSIPVGDYYYGDININDDPERMGYVESKVSLNTIGLYAGLGWQNLISTNHFGLSLDLGTYYALTRPEVNMSTTGYLVGNETNRQQLADNLKNYRWLPTLQLGFNYKF
ncbi:hypothetical protein F0919_00930 [Taibaiella lutea]|uniref:Outer membrane protein beta-barrel domain-containing protein n=1 Tax=Taibaiella lutea TaxID=2608001 RepID=A0A5M6CQP4_9BACT|nr:hypothetical protein [Taibaiella lutea]KAA5536262.1 hypothetical protein F0919_00930 [Taibaiella lutea]